MPPRCTGRTQSARYCYQILYASGADVHRCMCFRNGPVNVIVPVQRNGSKQTDLIFTDNRTNTQASLGKPRCSVRDCTRAKVSIELSFADMKRMFSGSWGPGFEVGPGWGLTGVMPSDLARSLTEDPDVEALSFVV
jgi:hypothetical protein